MKSFETYGEWWLPGTPDAKLKGHLRYDPNSGATLVVIGQLLSPYQFAPTTIDGDTTTTTMTVSALEQSSQTERICGSAEGKAYTLESCIKTAGPLLPFGGGIEKWESSQLFRGAVFEADEVLEFTGCGFELNLSHWVGGPRIAESIIAEDEAGTRLKEWQLTVTPQERRSFVDSDGYTVSLDHGFSVRGDGIMERCVGQGYAISITQSTKKSLRDFLTIAGHLQDLVSAGTAVTCGFEDFWLMHPDIVREAMDGQTERPLPIHFGAQWSVRSEARSRTLMDHDMSFTLDDLGGIEGVQAWHEVAKRNSETLGRVSASRSSASMHISDRLLNRAAALEGYDKDKHGGKATLENRLRRCTILAGAPFAALVKDVSKWIKLVVKERHEIAHHYSASAALSTVDQLFVADSAYWLFLICILRDANAPNGVFDHIQRSPNYLWLKPRIQALL